MANLNFLQWKAWKQPVRRRPSANLAPPPTNFFLNEPFKKHFHHIISSSPPFFPFLLFFLSFFPLISSFSPFSSLFPPFPPLFPFSLSFFQFFLGGSAVFPPSPATSLIFCMHWYEEFLLPSLYALWNEEFLLSTIIVLSTTTTTFTGVFIFGYFFRFLTFYLNIYTLEVTGLYTDLRHTNIYVLLKLYLGITVQEAYNFRFNKK